VKVTIPVDSPASEEESQAPTYWSQTHAPLVSLAFLAPLLIVYEIGVLWVGERGDVYVRNGADHWMRSWLETIGLGQLFLLPGLVVAVLLAWHIAGKYEWRISFDTLAGMFAESLLFAMLLVAAGQIQELVFREYLPPVARLMQQNGTEVIVQTPLAQLVGFIGAGIYEEVLFRLILLQICYGVFRFLRATPRWAIVLAVLSTSLAFSCAHYIGPSADIFTLFSFTFRAVAGLFFATLFAVRGFGITVGCHAAYDVIVGFLLVSSP
jgi:membrane protease YdiL (CAAX protease family)